MENAITIRYPGPWTIKETKSAFMVLDASGIIVAQVCYCEDDKRRAETRQMTRDEAKLVVDTVQSALDEEFPEAVSRMMN